MVYATAAILKKNKKKTEVSPDSISGWLHSTLTASCIRIHISLMGSAYNDSVPLGGSIIAVLLLCYYGAAQLQITKLSGQKELDVMEKTQGTWRRAL